MKDRFFEEDFNENYDCDYCNGDCKKKIHQYADISFPVKITPKTDVDDIKVECYGDPTSTCSQTGDGCTVTITQRVCLKIPVEFSATAVPDDCKMECDCSDGCCD